MIREELLALADELDGIDCREGCRTCPAYGTKDCRGDLPCEEAVARTASRRIRDIAEHDACEEGATTVSAYDLLSEEDRKAIAWVREHGGLDAVEKRLMPEGMEWPTVDGKPVDFVTGYEPSLGTLEAVSIYSNGACDVMSHDGIVKNATEIHVFKPKVLDADGVEIRVGDRLYDTDTGCGRTVRAVNDNGTVEFDGYENRGWFGLFLTHRAPVLAADGKPLEVGQTVWRDDGEMLEVLYLRPDGLVDCCGEIERPERLTHERPVLDADGVPIKKRDTVWHVASGREYVVVEPSYGETVVVRLVTCDDVEREQYAPDQLTHTKPEPTDSRQAVVNEICDEMAARIDLLVSAGRWQGTRTKGEQQ